MGVAIIIMAIMGVAVAVVVVVVAAVVVTVAVHFDNIRNSAQLSRDLG